MLLHTSCIDTPYQITFHQHESSRPTSTFSLLLTAQPAWILNSSPHRTLHNLAEFCMRHQGCTFQSACCLLGSTSNRLHRLTSSGLQIIALEADRWQAVLHCSRVQAGTSAHRRSAAWHQTLLHRCNSQAGSAAAGCQMHTGMPPLTSAKPPG